MSRSDDTEIFVPHQKRSVEHRGRADELAEWGVDIGAMTHVGYARANNEDQYAVVRRTRSSETISSSLPRSQTPTIVEHAYLMMVADGLGGEVFGELASQTALQAVQQVSHTNSWIMNSHQGPIDDLEERVEVYLQGVRAALAAQAQGDPKLQGMATTLTGAYCFGEQAIIANVGDSRAYLIRDQTAMQITTDHTMAAEMPPSGGRSTHPMYRNVLTRCLSTSSEPVRADIFQVDLVDKDQLLLCTDGLSDRVSDLEIAAIVSQQRSAKEACEKLVEAALEAGGHDNVTVVLSRHRLNKSDG